VQVNCDDCILKNGQMAIEMTCEDNEIQEADNPILHYRQVVRVWKKEIKTREENQFLYIF